MKRRLSSHYHLSQLVTRGGAVIFSCLFFFTTIYAAKSTSQSVVSLSIVNSYSGSLSLMTGDPGLLFTDNQWRTNNPTVPVIACASTGSTYTISGTLTTLSNGSGSNNYCQNNTVNVLSGDGIKEFSAEFMRDLEPYQTDDITVMLDTTAPVIPLLEAPVQDELVLVPSVSRGRTGVYDTGVGYAEVTILSSTSPTLTNPTARTTTGTQLIIPSSSLPGGTIYRTLIVRDFLGNESVFPISFFHNQFVTPVPEIPEEGGGGGGGGGSGWGQYAIKKDSCPFGDKSGSYYDKKCSKDEELIEDPEKPLTREEISKELSEEERLQLLLLLYKRFEEPEKNPEPIDPDNLPSENITIDTFANTPLEGYDSLQGLLNGSDTGFRNQAIQSQVEEKSAQDSYGQGNICYMKESTGEEICSELVHAAPTEQCQDCVEEFWYGLFLTYMIILCVGRDVEMYYFWRHWELGNTIEKQKYQKHKESTR